MPDLNSYSQKSNAWERRNVALFRFVMKERPGTSRITLAAGIAALVGPACAVLPYTDYLPAFLSPDLAGVWLLAAIGAIAIGIGVFAFSKGSKVAGTICVLTNIPVLAYWGFIAVFVSMGGGR
jgi:hypothetical protein